jgi:hypothetical protein
MMIAWRAPSPSAAIKVRLLLFLQKKKTLPLFQKGTGIHLLGWPMSIFRG